MFSRHIDGHHKLKRWRIVIHGTIDGLITYLQCNNNNLAATVLHLLIGAISIHSLPSSVRADFPVKNVYVARFVLDCNERGINRGSFNSGTSVHYQCVEGLWDEVTKCV